RIPQCGRESPTDPSSRIPRRAGWRCTQRSGTPGPSEVKNFASVDYNPCRVSTLNVIVLYDRWDDEDDAAGSEKAPLTRALDKKEVEDEVAEGIKKLGHEASLHCLDGSIKSLRALARLDGDLVFNLAESF